MLTDLEKAVLRDLKQAKKEDEVWDFYNGGNLSLSPEEEAKLPGVLRDLWDKGLISGYVANPNDRESPVSNISLSPQGEQHIS